MTLPALPIIPRNFSAPVPNQPFHSTEVHMVDTPEGPLELGDNLEFDPDTNTLSSN